MQEKESVLQEAERIINGDRHEDYGSKDASFKSIASLWSAYLRRDLSAHDVALMMILMKVSRAKLGKKKRDNYVDIAGYASLADDL